jgi:hypothetical protein
LERKEDTTELEENLEGIGRHQCHPEMCWKGVKKITKILSNANRCSLVRFEPETLFKYKPEFLPIKPLVQYSILINYVK